MKYLLTFFLICMHSLVLADSEYMGNNKEGFALSPKEAAEKAKPFLYESYKLRSGGLAKSEEAFWNMKLRTHVLLDGKYYLVVRDLPLKFNSQYEKHAVRVHKYSGMAGLGK